MIAPWVSLGSHPQLIVFFVEKMCSGFITVLIERDLRKRCLLTMAGISRKEMVGVGLLSLVYSQEDRATQGRG